MRAELIAITALQANFATETPDKRLQIAPLVHGVLLSLYLSPTKSEAAQQALSVVCSTQELNQAALIALLAITVKQVQLE
jgi:hypothetical protein